MRRGLIHVWYQSPLFTTCSNTNCIIPGGIGRFRRFSPKFAGLWQCYANGLPAICSKIHGNQMVFSKFRQNMCGLYNCFFIMYVYISFPIILSTRSYKHFPQSFPQGFSACLQVLETVFNRRWKTLEP